MSRSSKYIFCGGEYDAKMCRLCKRYFWRGGGSASSYQPRHRNTRSIILTLMNSSGSRGWQCHFIFQDLWLALLVVAKTCPHRPQALEMAKMIKFFRMIFLKILFVFWTRRLQVLQGMTYVCKMSIVLDVRQHQLLLTIKNTRVYIAAAAGTNHLNRFVYINVRPPFSSMPVCV